MSYTVTDNDRSTVTNGLRIAADTVEADVRKYRAHLPEDAAVGLVRVADSLEASAAEYRRLADLIEEAGDIVVTEYVEA